MSPAAPTTRRLEKMRSVARHRTRHIRLILQDIHHPHNVSACLRSAEAFGVKEVHIVCPNGSFRPSPVAQGVAKWLDLRVFKTVEEAGEESCKAGFSLFAAAPGKERSIGTLGIKSPIAVIFGNEHKGLDEAWEPFLSGTFSIPMVGFVESLNISVAAAITLFTLTERLRRSKHEAGLLSASDADALVQQWLNT